MNPRISLRARSIWYDLLNRTYQMDVIQQQLHDASPDLYDGDWTWSDGPIPNDATVTQLKQIRWLALQHQAVRAVTLDTDRHDRVCRIALQHIDERMAVR